MNKNSSGYEDPRINGPVSRTRTTAQARTRQAIIGRLLTLVWGQATLTFLGTCGG
jgi:hypothetical protein